MEQQQRGDEASEVEFLEVEYLLLALDFVEIIFLLAGFGPLQAALLKVFEPGCDGGAFHQPQRVTVLWEPKEIIYQQTSRDFELIYSDTDRHMYTDTLTLYAAHIIPKI